MAMKMNRFQTIFRPGIAIVAMVAFLLSSCVVSTNLGGVVGNIGVKESRLVRAEPFSADDMVPHPVQPGNETPTPPGVTAHDLRIFKLDDLYYMELYCQYVPRERGLFRLWVPHGGDMEYVILFKKDHDALARIPVEANMVLMDAETVQHCLQIKVAHPPQDAERVIPKERFDFSRAVRCTPNPEKLDEPGLERFWYNEYYMPHVPKRKNGLHYAVQPVAWAFRIVEHIPHVLVMAPSAIIAGPFWLVKQGQQQREMPLDKES